MAAANKRHSKEFHGVPILMWKNGKCTNMGCEAVASYVVHFKAGDSLPYCIEHASDMVRRPEVHELAIDAVLGALPIKESDTFGSVPHPPQIVYGKNGTPRLETPQEWRHRLADRGIPIPNPGAWEISERGIY